MSLWLSGWSKQLNLLCAALFFKSEIITNAVISFLNRVSVNSDALYANTEHPAGSSPAFALYDLHLTEVLLEMESLHVYLLAGWSEWLLFKTSF